MLIFTYLICKEFLGLIFWIIYNMSNYVKIKINNNDFLKKQIF